MEEDSKLGERHVDMVVVERDMWEEGMQHQVAEWQSPPKLAVIMEAAGCGRGLAADALITKPLRASTVAACLEHLVGKRKKTDEEMVNGGGVLRGLLAGKKILVVDDNRVNRRIAAAALTKYGASVELAESGMDALALLEIPHEFDACFMDVQMPEMDG